MNNARISGWKAALAVMTATVCLGQVWATSVLAQSRDSEVRIVFSALWNEAIDPMLSSSSGSIGLAAIFDDLVGAQPDASDYSKKTGIAEDWSMSSDGREWTLKIRKGIQFHRGFGELTSADVKFSLERLASERSMAQNKPFFKDKIARIETPDPYTVKVIATKGPIYEFLTMVSPLQGATERFVVSRKAAQALGEDGFARNPVGSGPFEFVRHTGGQSIEMKAVARHWRIGKPKFATAKFLAVPEEETGIAMLQRGDVDVMPVMRSNIKRLQAAKIPVVLQEGSGSIIAFMDDQFVKRVPVHDKRVREALNIAIDRKAIVDSIFEGRGRPIGSFYTQTMVLNGLGYDWKSDLYPYDPKRAKQLLAEAGYPNGFDIDVYIYSWTGVPEMPDTMLAVAGMWSQIGVRPNIITTEYGVVRGKLLKGEMPGSAGAFIAPNRPWQGLVGVYRIFMHSAGSFNHVKDPELDKFLDAAANGSTPETVKKNLMNAAHYIRANSYSIPLLEYDYAFGVTSRVKGWKPAFLPQNLDFDSMFRTPG